MRRPPTAFAGLALTALAPGTAAAHTALGAGDFYAGALQIWLHPDSVLLTVAACLLLAASAGGARRDWRLALAPAGLALGLAAGLRWAPLPLALTHGLGLSLGVLLAWSPARLPGFAAAMAAVALFVSSQEAAADARPDIATPGIFWLGGVILGNLLVTALAGACSGRQGRFWELAPRVLGSWIAAGGMILLAWTLRTG